MLRKIAQHAAVVTLYCTGIVLGLVAGIWFAGGSLWPELAALLGAALGAGITVMGAFWVSDHRADVERGRLRGILLDGIKRLRARADQAWNEHPTDYVARQRAREVYSRWQHLAAFSPYRELASFDQIRAMAEIDACCRNLAPYLEEPDDAVQYTTGGDAMVQAMFRTRPSANRAVLAACREIADRCQEAEHALSKP